MCAWSSLAGIGPGPFAAMLLADLGADVVRVDRPGGPGLAIDPAHDVTNRNKRSVVVDLKAPDGPAQVLDLAERADVLIEGYRPGVAERLGVGPGDCHARNPRLVYGRMTGWGQDGPLAQRAGHDIGYIALTGTLGMIGAPDEPPTVPANLVGDYAGGSLYLVVGLLAALHHARATGTGQVVDAAIVDGTAHPLLDDPRHARRRRLAGPARGANLLDGGCPFYGTYETADGRYAAVGALEQRFYAEFMELLGIPEQAPARDDMAPLGRTARGHRRPLQVPYPGRVDGRLRGLRRLCGPRPSSSARPRTTRTSPPAPPSTDHGGITQPAPAPRFSATPTAVRTGPRPAGRRHHEAVARDWDLPRNPRTNS